MKDQIKSEAKELLHKLGQNLDAVNKLTDKDQSKKIHLDSKQILNSLDSKLTSVSGEIVGWKYNLCSAMLQGAHDAVDSQLASGEVGVKNYLSHKAFNEAAKLLIDLL